MPVTEQTPINSYTANGSTTVFPYTFRILSSSDLKVYLDGVLQTSGYTVDGVGNDAGGNVTFTTAPTVDTVVRNQRETTIDRSTDYVEGGSLPSQTLDNDFDRIVMQVQELDAVAIKENAGGNWDAQNQNIINVADPVSAQDAATKNWSETAMTSQLVQATTQASNAAASASAASTSETNAATSETNAAASESAASTSETNAAASASAASTSAANAATSETNAAASASAASTSETNAGTSETNASSSETNAASSATSASTSATNAATSETNAAASAAAAAASAASGFYASIQDKSGAYTVVVGDQGDLIQVDASSGPITITLDLLATIGVDFRVGIAKMDSSANAVTVQRSGTDTINGGTSDTITSQYQVKNYVGQSSSGEWLSTDITSGTALIAANNLSDVANAGLSRTNLGLGTAAVLNTGTGNSDLPDMADLKPYLGKNRLANAQLLIWQRGTSFAIPAGGAPPYTADRWCGWRSTANSTFSRSGTAPEYKLKIQRDSGDTSTASIYGMQIIQSANCADLSGKTVTLSFNAVKGANFSAAGNNISVLIGYGSGVDQGSAAFIAGTWTSYTYTNQVVAITGTEARYSITGTVPIGTKEMAVRFSFAPTGTAGTDDSLEITDIQLEEGSVETNFANRTEDEELRICKYYFRKSYNSGDAPGATNTAGMLRFRLTNLASAVHSLYYPVHFSSPMRVAPSVTVYSPVTGTAGQLRDFVSTQADVSSGGFYMGETGFTVTGTSAFTASLIDMGFHYTANSEL